MKAGKLRPILKLVRLQITKNEKGHPREEWVEDPKPIYAERTKYSASQRIDLGEIFDDVKAEYKVRRQVVIGEKARVRDIRTGHLYDVAGSQVDVENDLRILSCVRVNE